jgi:hypothetical protein
LAFVSFVETESGGQQAHFLTLNTNAPHQQVVLGSGNIFNADLNLTLYFTSGSVEEALTPRIQLLAQKYCAEHFPVTRLNGLIKACPKKTQKWSG